MVSSALIREDENSVGYIENDLSYRDSNNFAVDYISGTVNADILRSYVLSFL